MLKYTTSQLPTEYGSDAYSQAGGKHGADNRFIYQEFGTEGENELKPSGQKP